LHGDNLTTLIRDTVPYRPWRCCLHLYGQNEHDRPSMARCNKCT